MYAAIFCVFFMWRSVAPLMGYQKAFLAPVMASPFLPVLLSLCLLRGVFYLLESRESRLLGCAGPISGGRLYWEKSPPFGALPVRAPVVGAKKRRTGRRRQIASRKMADGGTVAAGRGATPC